MENKRDIDRLILDEIKYTITLKGAFYIIALFNEFIQEDVEDEKGSGGFYDLAEEVYDYLIHYRKVDVEELDYDLVMAIYYTLYSFVEYLISLVVKEWYWTVGNDDNNNKLSRFLEQAKEIS